jgi:PAS domain S-box-containing protein
MTAHASRPAEEPAAHPPGAAESALEALLEAFPLLLFTVGPDDAVVDYRAGRAVEARAPRAGFVGRRLHEVMPAAAAAPLAGALARVRGGEVRAVAQYAVAAGGLERHLEARVVRTGADRCAVLIVDVGARRLAEESLARQRAQLEHVLASSPTVLYSLRLEGSRASGLQVSDNVERVLGYPPDTIGLGEWWETRVHPDDRERALAGLQRLADLGHVVQEYRFRHADGSWRWIRDEMRLQRDPAGRGAEAIGSLSDVSSSHLAEESLRASEERFRALIERSTDLLVVFDPEARCTFASPASQDVLGHPPAELVGTSAFDFVHPDDAAALRRMLDDLLARPELPVRITLRMRHRGGSWRLLETVARNLVHVPTVGGMVVNARDITEQRELEERFLQAQKLETVGRLAGGVAHDYNNLLTAIMGHAELVQEEVTGNPSVRNGLEEILRAAERGRMLTEQLLAVARRHTVAPRVLDLNGVMTEAGRLIARVLGEDVEFVVRPAPVLWPIEADPARLQQALLNLAVNAREAMPEGGRFTLETANCTVGPDTGARAVDLLPGPYVCLVVSDTGQGMTPEVRAHLFEPFFTTRPTGQGSGLGLAAVYGVVRQCGGAIEVDSQPGEGATFRLWFPRAGRPAAAGAPAPAAAPRGAGETLLVVEDDPSVRNLTVRLLRQAGFDVHSAARGDEALELARRSPGRIDLLLTDVVMPGMSGPQLADVLLRERRDLRVLFVSGYTQDTIRQGGTLGPGMAFMPKPYTPTRLVERIREMLDAPAHA